MFSLHFYLYGHGKLDLKFVHGMAEKCVGRNKVCPTKVHMSQAKITEEKIIEPQVLVKKVCLFPDTFAYVNNCYHN